MNKTKIEWARGLTIVTHVGVHYALRWLRNQDRAFWNASFLPTEYLNSGGSKTEPSKRGWFISLGFYFFAFYRGY